MKYKNPGDLFNAFQAKKKKAEESKEHRKHKKNWIAGAIKHPGALHAELGVKQGNKIPAKTLAKAAKKGGKIGKRARLAETLKSFHHKMCKTHGVAHTPAHHKPHHKGQPTPKHLKHRKMTLAEDTAYDKEHGIKEGSKEDLAIDKAHGVKDKARHSKHRKINKVGRIFRNPKGSKVAGFHHKHKKGTHCKTCTC